MRYCLTAEGNILIPKALLHTITLDLYVRSEDSTTQRNNWLANASRLKERAKLKECKAAIRESRKLAEERKRAEMQWRVLTKERELDRIKIEAELEQTQEGRRPEIADWTLESWKQRHYTDVQREAIPTDQVLV